MFFASTWQVKDPLHHRVKMHRIETKFEGSDNNQIFLIFNQQLQ
jgi:hypothetical protein